MPDYDEILGTIHAVVRERNMVVMGHDYGVGHSSITTMEKIAEAIVELLDAAETPADALVELEADASDAEMAGRVDAFMAAQALGAQYEWEHGFDVADAVGLAEYLRGER